MSAPAGTAFPPIALYIVLSLAVTVLSLTFTFYREAMASLLRKEWSHIFLSSIFLSFMAWLHLVVYLLWQIITPASSFSAERAIHQLVHLGVLSLFGHSLARVGGSWTGKKIEQGIMPREGD